MTLQLSDASKDLLRQPVFAQIATIAGDGSPQLSPVWIDVDGDTIVFNTAKGRAKVTNLERNPAVAISVVDPKDPYNGVLTVRGTVESLSEEGADDHINAMAKKYLGKDVYPFRQPGEERVIVRIRPDKIVAQPQAAGHGS
ncbi:MAG: PPOX class F420-dependent oxidoreductase [Actinomycetota bacterium]|nr:PPOX class F420-dependent oxidoreductase [Actinomycetota bacterium]